jgi:predicted transposase/invertase (TIGR01784 family)
MKKQKQRNPFSPRNDHYFKRLFGDERDHEILTSFLKAALDIPEDEYGEIKVLDSSSAVEYKDDKVNILDVKLKTTSGQIVDIEIQRYPHTAFKNRIVYQEAKLIEEQLRAGDDYAKLHRAICIIITEFAFIHENKSYHNRYELYDKRTKSTFSDILDIHIFELEKLPEADDGEAVWDWLKFIDSDEVIDMEAIAKKNVGIRKAVTRYKELASDEQEHMLAEAAVKADRDKRAMLDYAKDEGREEGRAEERLASARRMKEERLASAKRMKADGVEPALIAKYTGLTVNEIERL